MIEVLLTPQAQKDLKRLPANAQKRVLKKLSLLKFDPLAGKKLKGRLQGLFSLRIWPYRAIYLMQNRKVWVVHLQHRQGVFK